MGKHKSRGRKKRQQKKEYAAPKKQEQQTEEGSAILRKIRHSDPQTRLAALTALLHNTTPANKKDMALWQAVREQVMDRSLVVATTAVSCLEEFVQKSANQASSSSSSSSETDLTTAGWYLILLGRAQECYTNVCLEETDNGDNADASASNSKKQKKKNDNKPNKQQWFSLAVACFSAMNCLVQENPVVTERLERTASLRKDSFSAVWQWLSWSLQQQPSQDDKANELGSLGELQRQTVSLWHSLTEDNPGVVQPWFGEEEAFAKTCLQGAWNMIQQQPTQGAMSDLARLHLVGVILAAKNQLPLLDEIVSQKDTVVLLEGIKSFLRLPIIDDNALETQRSTLWESFQKARDQEQDNNLEVSIVKQQNIKKEPARAIARRLKQQQQKEQAMAAAASAGETNDVAMAEEGNSEKKGKLSSNRTDYVQEWQGHLEEWRQAHVTLELSLEMTANLTSSLVPMGNPDEGAMMQIEEGPLDADIRQVFSNILPLQQLLNQLTTQLCSEWPPIILQHLSDLQAKLAACLGHIIAIVGASSRTDGHQWVALWRDLTRAFEKQFAVAGTMVVTLQSQPGLIEKGVEPADLDRFLGFLTSEPSRSSPWTLSVRNDAQRDIVVLIGTILCHQKHTREINLKVCRVLMEISSPVRSNEVGLPVLAECLNVLMDIYSDDDLHNDVFQEMKVLSHFQQTLPILRLKVGTAKEGEMDLEYIKEIASNSADFILYKKGH